MLTPCPRAAGFALSGACVSLETPLILRPSSSEDSVPLHSLWKTTLLILFKEKARLLPGFFCGHFWTHETVLRR
jgi:hypothetical protein